jgi:hypothetical protein
MRSAQELAVSAGIEIEHIRKDHIRKEDVVAGGRASAAGARFGVNVRPPSLEGGRL